jgi:N-acetylmuramoyl-L-alanine amidase
MEAPKYLIMHFTTGTQLSSTINTFISEQGGVSTHLVIGRDGRVIQMVPFNKSGYHVGFGFWEGERNLNKMTIGIELDNAGYLRKENGHWLRKKTVIPPDRVEEAVHWKERSKRGWEIFPKVQLDTALAVVKALVQHYNLQDILGHDMINLINRTDPGPLFPIEDWREQIYGRRDPAFKPFRIVRETEIYANPGGDPPKIPHPQFGGRLPERSSVKILEIQGKWALVKVVATSKGGFNKAVGWIPAANIRNNNKADKTTADVVMYKKLPGKVSPPPPLVLKGSPLPFGTAVRLQEVRGVWTLVFVLDPIPNVKWMEGWVMSDAVQPVNPG